MPRFFAIAAWMLVWVVPAIGCGPKSKARQDTPEASDGFKAVVEWLEGPKVEDYSSARLSITRTDGTIPTAVSDVVFEPMMPTHGHGSFMDDQQIIPTDGTPNVFTIQGIYFTMRGTGADHWVIDITATVDGKRSTTQLPVDVP